PGSVPGASCSMHPTGQNSGHLRHGKQRLTSITATSLGRFFFSPHSFGQNASGMRSSFSRRRMSSVLAIAPSYTPTGGSPSPIPGPRRGARRRCSEVPSVRIDRVRSETCGGGAPRIESLGPPVHEEVGGDLADRRAGLDAAAPLAGEPEEPGDPWIL